MKFDCGYHSHSQLHQLIENGDELVTLYSVIWLSCDNEPGFIVADKIIVYGKNHNQIRSISQISEFCYIYCESHMDC